ncbi:MAG: protein translocase subunit SecF [Micromonosporaceae bacterium]|nr:protein translocase subunit SecF [Micromonosporaceae bacterium]
MCAPTPRNGAARCAAPYVRRSPDVGALVRLYRGETNFDYVDRRKRWYLASALLLLVCLVSIGFKGFNFGIEFSGGTQFMAPKSAGVTLADMRAAAEDAGVEVASTQQAGVGANARYMIKTAALDPDGQEEVSQALAKAAGVSVEEIAVSKVSSSWGGQVTQQALIALAVFLALVTAYLWVRFEQKMAFGALAALAHDVLITAGVYSLVGFEVTPSMVIGMLTILGYSLYDTVVVFDKVQENTRGVLGSSRQTYSEAANLAVNQTLMRSINTTLTSLLPVGALLVVGVYLLGAGTLKELALVLFIGMLVGTYSSLFIATPVLVDLKMIESRYRAQAKRVVAKRSGEEDISSKAARRQAKRAVEAKKARAKRSAAHDDEDAYDERDEAEELVDDHDEPEELDEDEATDRELAGLAPRPGARPERSRRRSGSRGGKRKR